MRVSDTMCGAWFECYFGYCHRHSCGNWLKKERIIAEEAKHSRNKFEQYVEKGSIIKTECENRMEKGDMEMNG